MRYNKTIIIFALLLTSINANAQLNTNEEPVSFSREKELPANFRSMVPVVTMPQLDMEKIAKEDEEDEEYDMPPRFGYTHFVNYNLNNSGKWYEFPNGDKLWQLEVVCPSALSVNFCYDMFWLPDGGKFFVYSKDRKHTLGAFTSRNNKGSRDDTRGFATGLIYGDDVVLEYYQPKDVTFDAIISIDYIVHGYRYIQWDQKSMGDAADCMVNINCEEGQNWQNEKIAVAMIIVNGHRYCTGSLINTTDLGQKPYLLTADHCLGGWANNYIKYDAVTSPYLDHYSFYWNYEAPGCVNLSVEPTYVSTSGATIVANNPYSDFALLRLSEDPQNLSNYTPYYLGWDHSGDSGNSGVCIHHPKGDIKKISTVASQPLSTEYKYYSVNPNASHWKVTWKVTQSGNQSTTEGGSSGSPLLTAKHRTIGQLQGGYADCGDSICAPDWYGKFSTSWTGNNNNSIYRRLNCWLDSLNTGVSVMEGLLVIPSDSTMNTNQQLYSNIRVTGTGQLTIQGEIELMETSRVIVESGGTLIIDGGTLSNADIILKVGSALRIKNGGVIETRNGFEAPVGATVYIEDGQIS